MLILSRPAAAALLLAIAPIVSGPAQAESAAAESSIEARAEQLEPGQYVWNPELASEGPVEMVISLPLQMAYVYRSGTLIGASTISSGREGYETPLGRFTILQKNKVHRSNRYNSAPMPYMQRLNWYGVALHGGEIPGYPASHGCVRLPMKFAQKLFGATTLGASVFIADEAPSSPEAALELARSAAPVPAGRGRTVEDIAAGGAP